MRSFVALLTLISVGHGITLNGFRAKYGNGTSEAVADNKDYFFKLPLNLEEAKENGYNQVENYPNPNNNYIMLCAPGRIICPLFMNATKGLVLGLRINIPVAAISSDLKPAEYFDLWNATPWKDEPAQDFWYATQIFKHGITGTTVTGLDNKKLWIPALESGIQKTMFKKQNCVPNMGTHYYYNMTRDLSCDKPMLPWFALVNKGSLVGVGFQTFGNKSKVNIGNNQKDWFEDIPRYPRTTPRRAIPDAPECFLDRSSKYGRLSIHIYYIEKPWELTCEPKDSANRPLAKNPHAVVESTGSLTTGLENGPEDDNKAGSNAKSHADPVRLNMVWILFSLVLLVACA